MAKLSEDQISEIQETFLLFDNKGDGKIAANQLGEVLRALGQNPTESDIKKCGFHGEQRISFEVFLPIVPTISKNAPQPALEDFIEGFKVFDKDGNASMSSAELRHILTSLGEKLTDEEVDQLFQAQEDAHGNINYEDFIKMVMSG